MPARKTIATIDELHALLNATEPTVPRIIPEIAVDIRRDLDAGVLDEDEFVGATWWYTVSMTERGTPVVDGQMIRCVSGRGVYAVKGGGTAVWGHWEGGRLYVKKSEERFAPKWYDENGYSDIQLRGSAWA